MSNTLNYVHGPYQCSCLVSRGVEQVAYEIGKRLNTCFWIFEASVISSILTAIMAGNLNNFRFKVSPQLVAKLFDASSNEKKIDIFGNGYDDTFYLDGAFITKGYDNFKAQLNRFRSYELTPRKTGAFGEGGIGGNETCPIKWDRETGILVVYNNDKMDTAPNVLKKAVAWLAGMSEDCIETVETE